MTSTTPAAITTPTTPIILIIPTTATMFTGAAGRSLDDTAADGLVVVAVVALNFRHVYNIIKEFGDNIYSSCTNIYNRETTMTPQVYDS